MFHFYSLTVVLFVLQQQRSVLSLASINCSQPIKSQVITDCCDEPDFDVSSLKAVISGCNLAPSFLSLDRNATILSKPNSTICAAEDAITCFMTKTKLLQNPEHIKKTLESLTNSSDLKTVLEKAFLYCSTLSGPINMMPVKTAPTTISGLKLPATNASAAGSTIATITNPPAIATLGATTPGLKPQSNVTNILPVATVSTLGILNSTPNSISPQCDPIIVSLMECLHRQRYLNCLSSMFITNKTCSEEQTAYRNTCILNV